MRGVAKLKAKIERAEKDMETALERAFPIGTRVRCWLMYGQVNPSKGEVIGHTGGRHAYVRIRLNSRKQEVRDVTVENVF